MSEHQIVDLSPTILYLLGYDVPSDIDGQVMVEALTAEYRETHSIRISGKAWKPAKDEAGFSPEEEDTVTERLRELGYL